MTTASLIPANPTTPPCPDWCTVGAHHDWDSGPEGDGARGHGVSIGEYIGVGSAEYERRPGALEPFRISLDSIVDMRVKTAEDARALAADLIEAAEWIEAHR